MDRTRVWLAVSPIVFAGVLAAHALAYRVTGTPSGSMHAYLEHAPQVLLVLALVGAVVAGLAGRLRVRSTWPFAAAALATFVVQEHLERLAHTGELPWLLDSRAFLVGLLLQLPFALLAWALARKLLTAFEEPRLRRARLPQLLLAVASPVTADVLPVHVATPRGRAPPRLHRP